MLSDSQDYLAMVEVNRWSQVEDLVWTTSWTTSKAVFTRVAIDKQHC